MQHHTDHLGGGENNNTDHFDLTLCGPVRMNVFADPDGSRRMAAGADTIDGGLKDGDPEADSVVT